MNFHNENKSNALSNTILLSYSTTIDLYPHKHNTLTLLTLLI